MVIEASQVNLTVCLIHVGYKHTLRVTLWLVCSHFLLVFFMLASNFLLRRDVLRLGHSDIDPGTLILPRAVPCRAQT